MRRPSALILATTTAVLLAACTGGGTDGASPTAGASDGSAAGSSPAAVDTADDGPLTPATAECLVGTWRLDLPGMQDDLRRTVGDDGIELEVAGTTTYTFADDGRFDAEVDSSSSLTMTSQDAELTSRTTSAGTLTGTWSLEGDQLTISDVDTSDLEVGTTASMDGADLDVPPGSAEDAIEALPPTSSTASCGDARATLVMPLQVDEGSDPVTITYTLRR